MQAIRLVRFVTLSLLPSLLLGACASHRDVRPGADGINRVVVHGPDKTPLEEEAIRQANNYCEDFKKSPAFLKEETKYTGSMDEDTHNTMRRASKAVMAGGSMASVFGGDSERNVGHVATGAGAMGGIMTDQEAYTVDMRFKCQ